MSAGDGKATAEEQLDQMAFSVRKPLEALLGLFEAGSTDPEYGPTLVKEALRALKGRG